MVVQTHNLQGTMCELCLCLYIKQETQKSCFPMFYIFINILLITMHTFMKFNVQVFRFYIGEFNEIYNL